MPRKYSSRFIAAVCILLCLPLLVDAKELNWPQFRGPDRTDVSKETGLLKEWPKEGPRRVWLFKNTGIGYSPA